MNCCAVLKNLKILNWNFFWKIPDFPFVLGCVKFVENNLFINSSTVVIGDVTVRLIFLLSILKNLVLMKLHSQVQNQKAFSKILLSFVYILLCIFDMKMYVRQIVLN